jgi:hypothetical protein
MIIIKVASVLGGHKEDMGFHVTLLVLFYILRVCLEAPYAFNHMSTTWKKNKIKIPC